MNETKKMLLIVIVIALLVMIIPITTYMKNKESKKIVTAIGELMEYEGTNLVFLGSATCSYCKLFTPILDDLKTKYGFDYSYVDMDKLSNSQYSDVLDKFEIDSSKFGTPYLAIVTNGKVVAEQPEYKDGEETFAFLQENGIISEDKVYVSTTPYLTKVTFDEYNKLIESKTNEIVVLTQIGCSACEAALPVLNEIANEYDLKINYFVLNNINTEELQNQFLSSLDYYDENEEFGTPLTLIVKDKKAVAARDGFYSKNDYITFFKTNGFINE